VTTPAANGTIGEYNTAGATVNAALISGLDIPIDVAIAFRRRSEKIRKKPEARGDLALEILLAGFLRARKPRERRNRRQAATSTQQNGDLSATWKKS
jgi:hypothetical protein